MRDQAGEYRPPTGVGEWAQDRLARATGTRHGLSSFIRGAKTNQGQLVLAALTQRLGSYLMVYRPENPLEPRYATIVTDPVIDLTVPDPYLSVVHGNCRLGIHAGDWQRADGRWFLIGNAFKYLTVLPPEDGTDGDW